MYSWKGRDMVIRNMITLEKDLLKGCESRDKTILLESSTKYKLYPRSSNVKEGPKTTIEKRKVVSLENLCIFEKEALEYKIE